MPSGLSRTAAPAKVTGLKQGLWLRWTKGSGWGQVIPIEIQVNAHGWRAGQNYQRNHRRISVPIRLQTGEGRRQAK